MQCPDGTFLLHVAIRRQKGHFRNSDSESQDRSRHTRLPECMRMYRIIAGNPYMRVRSLRRIFSKAICWRHYQVHLEQWFVWLIRNLPCCCWMPVKTRNILFTRCKEKRLPNNKMFHYIPACYINLGMLLYIKKLCPLHFFLQSLLQRWAQCASPHPTGKIIFLLQHSTNPAANSPCEPEWYWHGGVESGKKPGIFWWNT